MDLPLVGYSGVATLECRVFYLVDVVHWEGGLFVCNLGVILLMMEDEPDVVFILDRKPWEMPIPSKKHCMTIVFHTEFPLGDN